MVLKKDRLDSTKTFTIQFEAKGNKDFNAYIGSEQMTLYNGYITVSYIKDTYNKYSYSFIPRSNSYASFIFYGWLAKNEERTLEVRNIALQEGEYDNYSTTALKEYDTLNNTIPTPTRDNYTFPGWYTDPINGEKISSETIRYYLLCPLAIQLIIINNIIIFILTKWLFLVDLYWSL